MSFYLCELGEISGDYLLKSECEWNKMFKGTRDECVQDFLSRMIKIFSQYGENWGDIKLADLEYDHLWLDLKSDGEYLQVIYDKNRKHCHCENPLEVVQYGTCGGLRLGFAAVLVPENANIKYVRDLTVEEKQLAPSLPQNSPLNDISKFPSYDGPGIDLSEYLLN